MVVVFVVEVAIVLVIVIVWQWRFKLDAILLLLEVVIDLIVIVGHVVVEFDVTGRMIVSWRLLSKSIVKSIANSCGNGLLLSILSTGLV